MPRMRAGMCERTIEFSGLCGKMGRMVGGTVVPSWQRSGREVVASEREASGLEYAVRWFAWREVRLALAYGRAGGIALHRFRHDLRRFGLGASEPACHMLSVDRALLVDFAAQFGLRAAWIEPPRPRRPD